MSTGLYTGTVGEQYFQVRKHRRNPNAQAESAKIFAPHVDPAMVVLDFGCGTGGILSNLRCARRLGVEINEQSVAAAKGNGIEIFPDVSRVPGGVADVVISHHAIEHVPDPLRVVQDLRRTLRPSGRIVIVVPSDDVRSQRNRSWRKNPDNHLFSWTPLTLGNLLCAAGYEVEDARIIANGYSRYIEWARPVPVLMRLLSRGVAFAAGRYAVKCVGKALP